MTKIYNTINLILLTIARLIFKQKKIESEQKHFLIIRLDAIGDMILFSPFVRELRHQQSDAKITLVIDPLIKNLYENCPYVDEILYFKGRKPIKPQIVTSTFRAIFWGISNLKDIYSNVLLPRCDSDAEGALMLAITSKCSSIISFSEQQTKDRAVVNRGFDKFISQGFVTEKLQHEVETNLDFLRKMGYTNINNNDIEIWPTETENRKISKFLSENQVEINDHKLIAIGFSAARAHRCWPLENILSLTMLLKDKYKDATIILIGGSTDRSKAEYLKNKNPFLIDATGKLTLNETFVLLKQCCLYIGNDSGPMHLAAAGKTPVIEISSFPQDGDNFHSNSPKRFGPWKTINIILQPVSCLTPCKGYCSQKQPHCITQINPADVFAATNKIFNRENLQI